MFTSISVVWLVLIAAGVAFALTRGWKGLMLFAALIVAMILGVVAWNVFVSLRQ